MGNQEIVKKQNLNRKSVRMFYGELCVFAIFAVIAVLMIWHYYSVGSWRMDKGLADFMSSIRTPLFDAVFRFITATGETIPVIILTLIAVILSLVFKHRKEAALVALYMLGVWRLSDLLKKVIDRPRPAANLWLVKPTDLFSMPSGHSMNFMALMLISIYLIWVYSKKKKLNIGLTAIMLIYAVLVGLSRVYLHVHYISDVIIGWSLGAACAAVAVVIHRLWTESKMKEEPGN